MTESCENCRFWKRQSEGRHTGDCRRNAPRCRDGFQKALIDLGGHIAWAQYTAAGIDPHKVEHFQVEADGSEYAAIWPETWENEWCGEHQKLS
jgi:hypothetical protein